MTVGDILTLAGVAATLLVAVIAFVQSRRNKTDDVALAHETTAASQAQRAIEMALQERGLERRIDKLAEELAATGRQLNGRIDDESKARQRSERDLLRMREENLRRFVTREDWLTSQARIDRKLDAIGADVHELSKTLHSTRTGSPKSDS